MKIKIPFAEISLIVSFALFLTVVGLALYQKIFFRLGFELMPLMIFLIFLAFLFVVEKNRWL